jgi:hypothetical protein
MTVADVCSHLLQPAREAVRLCLVAEQHTRRSQLALLIWSEKEHGANVPSNSRRHQDVKPDTHTQVVAYKTRIAGTR